MKKNYLSRIGAFLLMSTMITSCFVGSTFAKYTSQGEGGDTARVAKWGVEVEVETNDKNTKLFKNEYSKDDVNYDAPSITVKSEEKVVAPGTGGTFGKISITGTPEVAVEIIAEPELTLTNWVTQQDPYCPIKFTITNGNYTKTINGLDYKVTSGGVSSFESNVEKAIVEAILKDAVATTSKNGIKTGSFEAGTDLSAITDDIIISWEWPFEGATGNSSTGYNQDNEKDSELGDAAATGTAPTIKLDLGITVDQVD